MSFSIAFASTGRFLRRRLILSAKSRFCEFKELHCEGVESRTERSISVCLPSEHTSLSSGLRLCMLRFYCRGLGQEVTVTEQVNGVHLECLSKAVNRFKRQALGAAQELRERRVTDAAGAAQVTLRPAAPPKQGQHALTNQIERCHKPPRDTGRV